MISSWSSESGPRAGRLLRVRSWAKGPRRCMGRRWERWDDSEVEYVVDSQVTFPKTT